MAVYQMRVVWEELGGHTHIGIWSGRDGKTLGKAGELILTNEEFQSWKDGPMVTDRVDGQMHIEFRRKIVP